VKKTFAWIGVHAVLLLIVLPGTIVKFDHFWQKWEFLAAVAAALYNLVFSLAEYAYVTEPGGKTLSRTLAEGHNVFIYLCLRVSVPSAMFGMSAFIIYGDHDIGHGPVDSLNVVLKLVMTFIAFAAVWVGDTVTERRLRGKENATDGELWWAQHLKRHAWVIDLPLVFGYLGLILIYRGHHGTNEELHLQAFVGGASALEMLILTAVHGFAEFADHRKRPLLSNIFRIPLRVD
jgi:hypothetical protein